jgi:hypothetical protein
MAAINRRLRICARIGSFAAREFLDYRRFISNPSFSVNRVQTPKKRLVRAIFFALALSIIEAPIILLLNAFQEACGLREVSPVGGNLFYAIAMLIFVGPLFEELVFRAGLRHFSWSLVVVPLVTIISLLHSISDLVIFFITAISLATIALVLWAGAGSKSTSSIPAALILNCRGCFIMNCCMFAIVHVRTYEFTGWQALAAILLTVPHFLSASVFGFLRIRYGISSGIVAHGMMNAVALGAYVVSQAANYS